MSNEHGEGTQHTHHDHECGSFFGCGDEKGTGVVREDIKDLSIEAILAVTISIFVLTLAALVVQIGASRFAAPPEARKPATTIDAGHAKPD